MHNDLLEIPKRFETERLIVHRYEPEDAAWYYATGKKNRAHLERYESGNVIFNLKSEEEAESTIRGMIADWEARKCFFMGAFEKQSKQFVAQIYIGVTN